jgi:hypothetical protein
MNRVELPVQHGFIEANKDVKSYIVTVRPAGWQCALSFMLLTTAPKSLLGLSAEYALRRALEYGGAYEITKIDK